MGKIIAVTNQKGGVAKTTTSINLAASLAVTKRRVLLVDIDPQGNATVGSGIEKYGFEYGTQDVLLNSEIIAKAIHATTGAFDIIPANGDLTATEVKLLHYKNREAHMKKALAKISDNYDFILIDCPPALSILTINALVAADSVLIPLQCEYYALEGLSALLHTIKQLQSSLNTELHIEGLLRTMYDGRNRLTKEVSAELHKHFPGDVYRTVIPRNIRLAEAPGYGVPALMYDKNSQGAIAYLTLAGEIIRKAQEEAIQV